MANRKSLEIAGVRYFSAAAVAKAVGVSRVTLWRWRQDAKIPPGHRYRDHQIIFTAEELEAVKEFANRVEPIRSEGGDQLRLFNGIQPEEKL